MSTHKIGFNEEISKIITYLSSNTNFICSSDRSCFLIDHHNHQTVHDYPPIDWAVDHVFIVISSASVHHCTFSTIQQKSYTLIGHTVSSPA